MNKLFNFLKVKEDNRSLVMRIYFIFFCSGTMSTLIGAVLPDIQAAYNLRYDFSGILVSSHQLGNLIALILSGFLPFAIGRKQTCVILSSGIVLGLVMMATIGNPVLLIIALALTGVGRGTLSNTTNVVVSENCENKAGGLNLLHAAFAVGAFISPFVAAAMGASWRVCIIIFAALMAVGVIFVGKSTLSSKPAEKQKGEKVAFVKDVNFWLVTLILFAYLCVEASLNERLVTNNQYSGLLSPAVAKSMSSLLSFMILIGRLVIASVSSKLKNKHPLILIMGLLMTAFYLIMMFSKSTAVIIFAMLGVGLSMGGIYPTTLSTQSTACNSSTVATGVCIGIATVGGLIWPSIIGFIAEQTTISTALMSIILALAVMVILMVIKLVRSFVVNP